MNYVQAVKDFASVNPYHPIWSIVLEIYADDKIEEIIKGATSDLHALDLIQKWVCPIAFSYEQVKELQDLKAIHERDAL